MKLTKFRNLLTFSGSAIFAGLASQSADALTLQNLTADDVDVMNSGLVTLVNGNYQLDGSQTLDSSKNYILTAPLFVMDGDTLTIPAGTKFYSTFDDYGTESKSDDDFGSLIITRGAQIDAAGTAAAPIEFTTIRELEAERGVDMDEDSVAGPMPTKADRGLWGGVVLLGNAKTYNYSAPGVLIGENIIEGFASSISVDVDNDERADIIEYGGSNDADSSGTMTYVSIRHGGYEFKADNEVNGLTLGGVGSGTTLEHIEVMSNSDDGIEFFGGTANLKYALVSFVKDDGFDLDEGYTGNIQFACVIQTPTDTDSNSNSIQDSDHGGEWDGNVGGDTNDFQTAPTIANITFIGDNESDHAFKIDDFFAGSVYNGAVTSFADLITVTGDAVLNDTASFTNVSTDVSNALEADNSAVESVLAAQFTDASSTGVGLNFVDVANALYDPRPAADSVLLAANGAAVTDLSADTFFEVTDYQGAFSQGSNWALGWTGTSDLGHFVNASDSILTNLTGDDVDVMASELVSFDSSLGVYVLNGSQTLDSTKNYILTDRLFVTDGNVLTIPAGTKIYNTTNDFGTADKADDEFGSIVITRGSQIVAEGTAAAPIEFTTIRELEAERGMDMDSDSVAGPMPTKADRGLWGGLVILGNARTYNYSAPGVLIGENVIEGFAPSVSPDSDNDGRADIIEYGGTNDEESSGILTYVSIRHGGYEFETDNEINGLTLGGVGSGTTLEHIEVMSNSDDGIEFFGGTANLKYALVSFVKDDGFDLDEGYTGNIQFACVIQTPTDTDSDDNSIQDSDHGGEWDGNVGGNTNDFQTAPTIANITFIGDNEGDHAFKIDDFFAGSVYNGAVTSFADLVTVTGDAVLNDTASFTNVSTDVSNALEADNVSVESVLAAQFTDASSTGVGLNFVDVANALYDPRPAADSVLLAANGAAVTDLSADTFFEVTDYQGAFSQGSNWALGWTGTSDLGHFVNASDSILTNLTGDDVDVMASELVSFDSSLGVYVLNGSQTLDSTKNYILTDRLFVTDGNVLTIPAGTKIYNTTNDFGTADKADDEFGSIVITRGSQIVAEGTAAAPIEFTTIRELEAERGMDMDSDSVAGPMPTKADRGLWGGLVILGNARTYNYSAPGVLIGENVIEGFAPSVSPDADNDGRADIIEYGGTNDEESSGILTYVSIRHGGYEFETDNEINGLTLGGVGSGTTLEYIEVMSNSDDGIEFFGGTANLKYALVSFVKDDGFDLDEGYTGNIQFACVIQTPTDTDSDDNSIQDSDHGGEWDGNVGGDTNDFQTAPTIANITFIGDNEGDHAFKIDDFFAGSVYNGAVTSFADLVTVTGDAVLNDTASFTNVSTDVSNALEADNVSVESVLAAQFTDASSTGVGLNFVDVANALYDPRPAADSVLLAANGAAVTDLSADSFFEVTDYQGAFSQGSNWALGWTGTDALGHFLQPDGDVIITSISKDGNNATIEFMSEASATYQITYSDDLTSFADTISGETGIPGTGGVVSRTFLIPDGTPEKLFFRVEEE